MYYNFLACRIHTAKLCVSSHMRCVLLRFENELDALNAAFERLLGPANSREAPVTQEQSFAQFHAMTVVRDVRCGKVYVARAIHKEAANGAGSNAQSAVVGRWLRVQVLDDSAFETRREVVCALLDYGGRLRVSHCDLFLLPQELEHQSNSLPFLVPHPLHIAALLAINPNPRAQQTWLEY